MKNYLKILNLILFLAIFSTAIFFGYDKCSYNVAFATESPAVETSAPTKKIAKTIPERNAYALTRMKKPMNENRLKYAVLKFFAAMFGVLVSVIAIFLGLKFYKKMVLKNNLKLGSLDYNTSLESPSEFKDVINLFLDKTDK